MHHFKYLPPIIFFSLLFVCYACTPPEPAVREMKIPAGQSSRYPFLVAGDSGDTFLSWVEYTDRSEAALKYARLGSSGYWSEPSVIARGSDWFVNWADFPSIVADNGGLRAAHWLHTVPGDFAYEVKLSVANPTGESWSPGFTLHNDSTATEHGFVSMIPLTDDQILAIWLDGRNTAGRAEDEYADLSRAMTLRSALISGDGTVSDRTQIDGSVCDCCQTSMAKTETGAVAAYRNRTGSEIRDIYVSRYRNGGWSDPMLVYGDKWKIGGCPVNGPAVAASKNRILVAWFTGANESNRVKAAISPDGGMSFAEPVSIDEGTPIGRVDAAFVDPATAAVSWMEKTADGAALRVRLFDARSGRPGRPVTVTRIDPDRSSGFPRMAVRNRQLLFAWTQTGEPSRVQMASVPLDLLKN